MTGTRFMSAGEDCIDDAKAAGAVDSLSCQAVPRMNSTGGISRMFKGAHDVGVGVLVGSMRYAIRWTEARPFASPEIARLASRLTHAGVSPLFVAQIIGHAGTSIEYPQYLR